MRVGELTVSGPNDYDECSHLSLADLFVDSRENPCLLRVTIKQSKMDPFHRRVNVYLGDKLWEAQEDCHAERRRKKVMVSDNIK